MTGENGLCRPMEGAWGGEDCWGEGAIPDERWRVLLQSGCQEGLELQGWWGKVQREAREAAQFLGEPLDLLLTSDPRGLGGSCRTGATRGQVVEARDMVRSRLLTRSLELHRPKKDRHAWAWRQRDKLSSAWLLSLPGGGEFLSNEEFSNSAAINLCVPPPCVAGQEGETIRGRAVVDRHGDAVQSTVITGDHFRQRHDLLKMTIYDLCRWAGLPAEVEVFNLFSRLIPQEGLARFEKERQRQAVIPDFRIVVPVAGQPTSVLHELKCISVSQSRYKPGGVQRAVDKRADELHEEYVRKAKEVDRLYVGTQPGHVGPVQAKLLSFERVQGLVFGAFGEASQAVHQLIDTLANSRVFVAGPQRAKRGFERSVDAERALVVGHLRRRISITACRAQCHTLLSRLQVLGPAGLQKLGARAKNVELHQSMQRDRMAFREILRTSNWRVKLGFGKNNQ